jgi:hypothetical protein
MRATSSAIALWIVTVSAGVLTFQSSLADDTNTASAGTIDLRFENCPVIAVVDWLVRLTNKPLITPTYFTSVVNYRPKRKLTREEAIQGIAGALQTNGLYFVNVDNLYNRLLTASETNNVVGHPHIEIEVRGDRVLVDGRPIRFEDLTGTISNSITADTEVWISAPSTQTGEQIVLDMDMWISQAHLGKLYRAYLP